MFGNFFHPVKEAEEDVAQKEKQYNISGSTKDRAVFFFFF